MIHPVLDKIHNKLIVSCQAEGDSPFNSPEGVTMFAIAAIQGGAEGIRSEGIEKTKSIIERTNHPVIGLVKGKFDDGTVCITRDPNDIDMLYQIGTHIISIDGTDRKFSGYSGPELIKHAKIKYPDICIMADISTADEAEACIDAGADIVSTTLRGYTPTSIEQADKEVDIAFIEYLCEKYPGFPIAAEGKINTALQAAQIAALNVHCIIIGSAITRPHLITKGFKQAINW